MLIGNRIPREYFITRGTGESDITVHAGSYHLALKNADIEKANIMTYSSILPAIAKEIIQPKSYVHGEVMESIMAAAHGEAGSLVTAGITYGWLYHRKSGEKYGGLVCEHNGSYSLNDIKELLNLSLQELYENGFREDFQLRDTKLITESFIPKKKYGTALVALCFTNYFYPLVSKDFEL